MNTPRASIACVALCVAGLAVTTCVGAGTEQSFQGPADELALEQRATGPTPVFQEIDWAAVQRHPRLPAELRAQVPERIRRLPVPVLLPPGERWLTDAKITSRPRWYAASLHLDGHHVYVSGTAVAMRVPGLEPGSTHGLRVLPATGAMTATWRQFGVTYLVSLECEDPEHDPRCTEQPYVRGLVESLLVAGGTP